MVVGALKQYGKAGDVQAADGISAALKQYGNRPATSRRFDDISRLRLSSTMVCRHCLSDMGHVGNAKGTHWQVSYVMKISVLTAISAYMLPVAVMAILCAGLAKKVKIFETFMEGASEG